MKPTHLLLHTAFPIAEVDPRIFGGFLEHMGRAVYEGVYQPTSPHADPSGLRADVMEALRGLELTALRYPGGNFASGYHWENGVGRRAERPVVRELAWRTIETNEFGTDEFLALADEMGWTPMLTVNLGTGSPEEARNWVEYTNAPPGTLYADRRVRNGRAEPWGVPLWCLGNELDGPWQLGHVPAAEYARRAEQAAKLMKGIDRSIELVVSGSSSPMMPTYLEWDRTCLEVVGRFADYISAHRYVGNPSGETADYLAIGASIDRQIEEVDSVCRYVAAKRRSQRRPYISFDEWNVWYRTQNRAGMDPRGEHPPHLVEEEYSLEDALVVASFLHSFVRHADVVKIANLAQIVNVIAPILTRDDDLLLQSIYYPFQMFSRRRRGRSLRVALEGPRYRSEQYGEVPLLDVSAILDRDLLKLFVTNRSAEAEASVEVELADGAFTAVASAEILRGPDAQARNTWEKRDVICSRPYSEMVLRGGRAHATLPRLSFLAVTLEL